MLSTHLKLTRAVFQRPAASKNHESTLYPDVEIYPTIDDILNGRDPVFEKAMEF